MEIIRYIDLSGNENSMPRSIWNELGDNKGGLRLAKPQDDEPEDTDNQQEPVNNPVSLVQQGGVAYPTDQPPSKEWTVPQLVAYAKDNTINLGRAKREDAILKAIQKAGH